MAIPIDGLFGLGVRLDSPLCQGRVRHERLEVPHYLAYLT